VAVHRCARAGAGRGDDRSGRVLMQVYFARSIRGNHSEGENLYLREITNTIKKRGHTLAMETKTSIHYLNLVDQNQFIHDRDLEWIDKSQAMIAEVSNPSLGVGYEIAYAKHVARIPILAVAFKDTGRISAMVQGCLNIFYYRGCADLSAQVEEFLADPDHCII
jgi:2'-deoxynucleoside 5'-phosphate N-hydrolase